MEWIKKVKETGFLTPYVRRMWEWLDPRRRLVSLLLFGIFIYLLFSLITSFFLWEPMEEITSFHTDLDIYRDRGAAILSGKIPYRDFYSESPPLILYFFVPAQAAGGSVLAYALEFGAVAVLTSIAVYLVLRNRDPFRAYLASIFLLCSPGLLITSVILIQDEVIVLLLYMLPLLLLIAGSRRYRDCAAVAVILGGITKVFSTFQIPLILIEDSKWRDRIRHLLIMAGVVFLVIIPFLVADLEAFLSFPEYYLDTWRARPTTGISLWHFLLQMRITVPTGVLLAAMLISLAFIYFLIWKKKVSPLTAGFMIFLPFLLFFPKIHEPYYLIPAAIMSIFGAEKERYLWLGVLVFVLPLISSGFSTPVTGGENIYGLEGGWLIIPIAITMIVYYILLYTAWQRYRMESGGTVFTENDSETRTGNG